MLELPDVISGGVGELFDEFDDGREALGGGLDLRAKDPDAVLVAVLGLLFSAVPCPAILPFSPPFPFHQVVDVVAR